MSQQYQAVAAILKNAIGAIHELLSDPEDELHKLSVTNDLQRSHDRLLLLTGTGDLETGKSAVLGPAKTIGGKPIAKQRRFTEADLVPSDDKVFKLKQDIDDALFYFGPDASAEGILANIPEIVIRGVAKKAGLKVSKEEPKELTVEFIEEVKAAVALLPKPETTEEELQYLAEKHTPLFLSDKPEGVMIVDDPLTEPTPEQTKAFEETIANRIEQANAEAPKPDTKKKAGK